VFTVTTAGIMYKGCWQGTPVGITYIKKQISLAKYFLNYAKTNWVMQTFFLVMQNDFFSPKIHYSPTKNLIHSKVFFFKL
jgi:hypothetical protein